MKELNVKYTIVGRYFGEKDVLVHNATYLELRGCEVRRGQIWHFKDLLAIRNVQDAEANSATDAFHYSLKSKTMSMISSFAFKVSDLHRFLLIELRLGLLAKLF